MRAGLTRVLMIERIAPTLPGTASGTFVKKRVRGMRKHGQYRGIGAISVSQHGIGISGRHVYSLGQRWLFGGGLAIGILILTAGMFAPGILLLYPVVEYLWLKKGDQLVTFDRVEAYNTVPEESLIAIEFRGTPWETPVVLKTPEWQVIYDALSTYVKHARVM